MVLCWACVSCGPSSQPQQDPGKDVVARVGEEVISRQEFEAEWSRRGHDSPGTERGVEGREQLLAQMIQTKAALQRARASGFDQRPETIALVNDLIASRYLEEFHSTRLTPEETITDAEVAGYYQSRSDRFQTPAAVRAGVILIEVSPKATPEKRDERKTFAEDLLQQAHAADNNAFKLLVQQHSEDSSTRYIGGDTGWLTGEGLAARWEPEVLQAALTLRAPGEIAPLVSTDRGFRIVRLTARRESGLRPLEEVAEVIKYQLQQTRLRDLQVAIRHELTNGIPITINHAALKSPAVHNYAETPAPPSLPGG